MATESSNKQEQLSLPELETPITPHRQRNPPVAPPDNPTDASAKRRKPAASRRPQTKIALVTPHPTQDITAPTPLTLPDQTLTSLPPASPGAEPATTPSPVPANADLLLQNTPDTLEVPLRRAAHLGTLAASIVAIIVLIAGASQFSDTQRAQRASIARHDEVLHLERDSRQAETHAKAVELFMKYNELMLQLNTPLPKGAKRETRYWKENLALGLLDALTNLTHGNREWENTITWALERHARFIREQRTACTAYSDEFIHLLEKSIGGKTAVICRENVAGD